MHQPRPLISLPNSVAGSGHSLFLAMIDVDRFAVLEELAGYEAAHAILTGLSERVGDILPDCLQMTVNRTAIAVEFAAGTVRQAEEAMTGLCFALSRTVDIQGYQFDMCVTVGLVAANGASRPELIVVAERAVVRARRSRLRVLTHRMGEGAPINDGLGLMRMLQRAIRDDTLELHYQPKVRSRTGETASVEALLRWTDPERGAIPPDMFVPMAERTGDIAALTEWVVGRAIADQATMLRQGHMLRFDINISSSQLADPGFGWRLLHQFTAVQGQIGFEITETAMMEEPEHALSNLQTFAEAGVRLAIDDYGSGFSSLAYLQKLPITELKIDKMFIQRLTYGHRDPLLIRSTIDLAHALEMEVTGEGVEAATTLALLQVMGCDLVQGYYFARPLRLSALADYLSGEPNRTGTMEREFAARLALHRGGLSV